MYAYIIPFCSKDYPDILFNVNLWNKKGHQISTTDANYQIDLVFYSSYGKNQQQEEQLNNVTKNYKHLFSNIVFKYYDIDKKYDYHPKAPGFMFFDLVLNETKYDYIFYAEPDCIAIKDNWLSSLNDEFNKCKLNNNWIKGSMYRGINFISNDMSHKLHFNGNAIYNTKSESFKNLLKKVKTQINFDHGYDGEMMRVLLKPGNNTEFREFFAHAVYTNFILNFGKQNYSTNYSDETVFLHGKKVLIDMKNKYKEK